MWRNSSTLGVSRADADGIFRHSMRELGVPFLRRWMMWAAVRRASGPGRQFLLVLLVSIPAVAFIAIPGLVITLWLVLFWLLELPVYLALKIHLRMRSSRKQVNKPDLTMTIS